MHKQRCEQRGGGRRSGREEGNTVAVGMVCEGQNLANGDWGSDFIKEGQEVVGEPGASMAEQGVRRRQREI